MVSMITSNLILFTEKNLHHGLFDISNPREHLDHSRTENTDEDASLARYKAKEISLPTFQNENSQVRYVPSELAKLLHLKQLKHGQNPYDFLKLVQNDYFPHLKGAFFAMLKRDTSQPGLDDHLSTSSNSENDGRDDQHQTIFPYNEHDKRNGNKRQKANNLYNLLKGMKKFSWIENEDPDSACLGSSCELSKRSNNEDRFRDILRLLFYSMHKPPILGSNEDDCIDPSCTAVKRGGHDWLYRMFKTLKRSSYQPKENEGMYRLFKTMKKPANDINDGLFRVFKTMKRAPNRSFPIFSAEEASEGLNCVDPNCSKPKRGQEKLYQMFKTMKKSDNPDDAYLYKSLRTMKKSNDLYRAFKTMKKPDLYPLRNPMKRSNDLYRSLKTMKRSNDLYRSLKTIKRSNDLYRYLKTMKRSNDLYRAFKTMKKSNNLYRSLKTMKRSNDLYRAFKTMKKSSGFLEEPQVIGDVSPQSGFKRTKTKLYRILRTMKRNDPNPVENEQIDNKENTNANELSSDALSMLPTESANIPFEAHGGRAKRSSEYMKYFSRYNKARTGQRLKSTRQHLTLRLSKRSGSPVIDEGDDQIEDTMKHLILRMSKKDGVKETMKHLILRMSKKDDVADTMKHLILRMSKKDDVADTMKHLILRMSKKDDVADTMKHLILRMSKKDNTGEDNNALKDSMKHLILRLSKKEDDPREGNALQDSMKHLRLRLSKKDDFLTDDTALKDSMEDLILRLSKKDGGVTNDDLRLLNTMQHMITRLSKKESPSSSLDKTRQHLTLRLSKKGGQLKNTRKHLILRLSKKDKEIPFELDEDNTSKRNPLPEANPEIVEYLLRRLYLQVYPPILTGTEEGNVGKREEYEKESPDMDQNAVWDENENNISDPEQNQFGVQVGDRMWDKRVQKSDEIYRLLRTMRGNPETISSSLFDAIDDKHIPSKKLKHVLVRMV